MFKRLFALAVGLEAMVAGNSRKINEDVKNRGHKYGGARDRNTGAIYYPKPRGKRKGYMK